MGLADGKMEPFIVGGDYIDIREFPHSVYLYIECTSTYICGGSILNSRVVLTAGHCLYDCQQNKDDTIIVNYGDSSINKMKSSPVSKFLVHDKYDEERLLNDIGMMLTFFSIPFGEVVQRVAILHKYPTRAVGGFVTGWGIKNSKGETSLSMKYVYQELQNYKACNRIIDLPPGTFCAQSEYKQYYPDQGDSGGAFVVYKYIQIGIVSFKHVDHNMVAYTNVTHFYDWIQYNAMLLSCTDY